MRPFPEIYSCSSSLWSQLGPHLYNSQCLVLLGPEYHTFWFLLTRYTNELSSPLEFCFWLPYCSDSTQPTYFLLTYGCCTFFCTALVALLQGRIQHNIPYSSILRFSVCWVLWGKQIIVKVLLPQKEPWTWCPLITDTLCCSLKPILCTDYEKVNNTNSSFGHSPQTWPFHEEPQHQMLARNSSIEP